MAEANGPATAGQVARPGKSRLAVRLQLRGAQPDTATATDGATADKAPGEVCLNHGCRPPEMFPEARRPWKHRIELQFKQIFSGKKCKSPTELQQSGEFQQVPNRTLEQRLHICHRWIETLVKRFLLRVVCCRFASCPLMHRQDEYGVRLADDTAAEFDPIYFGHRFQQCSITAKGKTSRRTSQTATL